MEETPAGGMKNLLALSLKDDIIYAMTIKAESENPDTDAGAGQKLELTAKTRRHTKCGVPSPECRLGKNFLFSVKKGESGFQKY